MPWERGGLALANVIIESEAPCREREKLIERNFRQVLTKFDHDLQNMGRTPLHIAASKGDEEMVKFLQTAKANPNILDNVR